MNETRKINWKRKLTSRKFWLAVIGFVTSIMSGVGASADSIARATSVMTAGAVLIGYMFAEGLSDAGNLAESTDNFPDDSIIMK